MGEPGPPGRSGRRLPASRRPLVPGRGAPRRRRRLEPAVAAVPRPLPPRLPPRVAASWAPWGRRPGAPGLGRRDDRSVGQVDGGDPQPPHRWQRPGRVSSRDGSTSAPGTQRCSTTSASWCAQRTPRRSPCSGRSRSRGGKTGSDGDLATVPQAVTYLMQVTTEAKPATLLRSVEILARVTVLPAGAHYNLACNEGRVFSRARLPRSGRHSSTRYWRRLPRRDRARWEPARSGTDPGRRVPPGPDQPVRRHVHGSALRPPASRGTRRPIPPGSTSGSCSTSGRPSPSRDEQRRSTTRPARQSWWSSVLILSTTPTCRSGAAGRGFLPSFGADIRYPVSTSGRLRRWSSRAGDSHVMRHSPPPPGDPPEPTIGASRVPDEPGSACSHDAANRRFEDTPDGRGASASA